MSEPPPRPLVAAWMAAAIAVALWWLGRGVLATPPVHDAGALGRWLRNTDPVTAAFAAARATAALLAAYLAVAITAATVAERAKRPTVAAAARRLVPATFRPFVGVVAASSVAASVAAISAPRPTAPAVITAASTTTPIAETATLELVQPASVTAVDRATPTPSTGPATTLAEQPVVIVEAPGVGAAPTAAVETWTIAPGDHLWAVAAETLADHWRRPPTDREIVPYWRTLVEANRDRLVDHDQPDLVLPGQVFVLPPVPPAPSR
jgi:hypothetical protein